MVIYELHDYFIYSYGAWYMSKMVSTKCLVVDFKKMSVYACAHYFNVLDELQL